MTPIAASVIETLKKYDSATIANVIELFGVRSRAAGYTGANIKAIYPQLPPAVGFAVTATFRSGYPAPRGDVYGGMPALIAAAEQMPAPRIVVFQDLDDIPRAATYGEIMATTFQKFDFAGLITNGAARDIEQVRAMNFPCFASGIIVAHGYCRVMDVNVPVQIDGLDVRPGNLLHADANGVVDIPLPLAAEVAALCQPFVDAENIVLHPLRGDAKLTAKDYDALVQRTVAQIQSLGRRAQAARDRLMPA